VKSCQITCHDEDRPDVYLEISSNSLFVHDSCAVVTARADSVQNTLERLNNVSEPEPFKRIMQFQHILHNRVSRAIDDPEPNE
jgi:hypothetical protein